MSDYEQEEKKVKRKPRKAKKKKGNTCTARGAGCHTQ